MSAALGPLAILPSLFGSAASAAQPGPSNAERGNDYNPVTNINAPAGADYAGITQLFNAINAGNPQNGGLLTAPIQADAYVAATGTNYDNYILIGIAVVVGLLVWRKLKK